MSAELQPPERVRPIRDADGNRPEEWAAPGAALVRTAASDVIPTLAELGRVHIMGIAGAGMSALARILLARGVPVSGCESRDSSTVDQLRAIGADVQIGNSPVHVFEADTFVFTTAINPKHPEFVAARSTGMLVLRRAAALAASLEGRRCVAISGTHGKTTTTALLTVAAQACGLDPSYAIGGSLRDTGLNGYFGTGDLAIVEADESDGSFLLLRPAADIVTNVEADHLENHGDLEAIHRAFTQFVDRLAPEGTLVVSADDPGALRVAAYAAAQRRRVISYGESPQSDLLIADLRELPDAVGFTASGLGIGTVEVRVDSVLGRHMASNAAAALALAADLGMDVPTVIGAWRGFAGVHRRFELRGIAHGVRVYDDYAHHPTEVAASLRAAQAVVAPGARLIAIFQPGTYSRTQTFASEFADAMSVADVAVVMDIFPAREEPIPGVTGQIIAEQIPRTTCDVMYLPADSTVALRIAEIARPGDVVVTMGIGDVYLQCPKILKALDAQDQSQTAR